MLNLSSKQHDVRANESADWMTTTQWSLVKAAGDENSPARQDALAKLCTAYWQPLYAYIRRRGHNEHDAADLTQEFFTRLVSRNDLGTVHPTHGRFRAFLLAAVNHLLANEWRNAKALKRGAGRAPISLEVATAESHMGTSVSADSTPERLFDRRWAETVMERAGRRLHEEFTHDGREQVFRAINQFLSKPVEAGDYESIVPQLHMTKPAIAKSVERMRRRYRELVRAEIAQTVTSSAELDEEMRYLLEVLT